MITDLYLEKNINFEWFLSDLLWFIFDLFYSILHVVQMQLETKLLSLWKNLSGFSKKLWWGWCLYSMFPLDGRRALVKMLMERYKLYVCQNSKFVERTKKLCYLNRFSFFFFFWKQLRPDQRPQCESAHHPQTEVFLCHPNIPCWAQKNRWGLASQTCIFYWIARSLTYFLPLYLSHSFFLGTSPSLSPVTSPSHSPPTLNTGSSSSLTPRLPVEFPDTADFLTKPSVNLNLHKPLVGSTDFQQAFRSSAFSLCTRWDREVQHYLCLALSQSCCTCFNVICRCPLKLWSSDAQGNFQRWVGRLSSAVQQWGSTQALRYRLLRLLHVTERNPVMADNLVWWSRIVKEIPLYQELMRQMLLSAGLSGVLQL